MKGKYIVLGIGAGLVIALLGYLYLISHTHRKESPGIQGIEETVKLARNIQQMQATAAENLGRAEKIAEAIKDMRKPIPAGTERRDPFAGQRVEEEPQEEKAPPGAPPPTEPITTDAEVQEEAIESAAEHEWPEMTLSAIALAGDGPLAVINDEVYAVGDVVEGLKVTDIQEGRVELVEAMSGRRHALEIIAWKMKGTPDEE